MASCLVSPFRHLEYVPFLHQEAWAIAVADVLRAWRAATNDDERERMLKWFVALHDILLRVPPRGGRRGRAAISHRFAAWAQGDFGMLVRWWLHDRAAVNQQPQSASTGADAGRSVERALALLRDGHISRAIRTLSSDGLGDLLDDRIVAQLRAKHPPLKQHIEPLDTTRGPHPRLHADIRGVLQGLDDKAGSGVSGLRNAYLQALTRKFADTRASEAIELLEYFVDAYVNVELPSWFYVIYSNLRLVALVKPGQQVSTGPPDVRPLGLGECLRRAIHSAVAADLRENFREHFWPQQVAVGIPGGAQLAHYWSTPHA